MSPRVTVTVGAAAAAVVALAVLQRLKGMRRVKMPVLPITSDETLASCKALAHQPGDTFIASYPKSGTTWVQNIVATLINKGAEFGHVSECTPFFEIDPHWEQGPTPKSHKVFNSKFTAQSQKQGRRCWNTHLLWEQMPKHVDTRYIYIVREGKDVATSFYHHLTSQDEASGGIGDQPFPDFIDEWFSGLMPYGRWVDHLKAWEQARGDGRVLFLKYEDMKRDLSPHVHAIARHLNLPISPADIDKLIPSFSITSMRDNINKFQPISVKWKGDYQFIRKGEIGDSKNLFTQAQADRHDAIVKEVYPKGLPDWAR